MKRLVQWLAVCGAAAVLLCGSRSLLAQAPGGAAGGPQGANVQRPAGQASAGANPAGLAPDWIPISKEHEKFIDQVLDYWEFSSGKVERYRCKFQRWEYDSVFGPRETYKTYSTGVIKYAAPDKGLFRVEETLHYTPAGSPQEKPSYKPIEGEYGDHWICDGKSVFEFDGGQKQLIERPLPPDMRGKAIADGPLPFVFGAKKQQIKNRYWLKVCTPEHAKHEYWLEAWPKRREDAANYKKVEIVIDEEDFLPKAMIIYMRGYNGRDNQSRTVFTFDERETNWNVALQQLNLFHREFFEPKTPSGWTRIVEDAPGGRPAPAQNQQPQPRGPFSKLFGQDGPRQAQQADGGATR